MIPTSFIPILIDKAINVTQLEIQLDKMREHIANQKQDENHDSVYYFPAIFSSMYYGKYQLFLLKSYDPNASKDVASRVNTLFNLTAASNTTNTPATSSAIKSSEGAAACFTYAWLHAKCSPLNTNTSSQLSDAVNILNRAKETSSAKQAYNQANLEELNAFYPHPPTTREADNTKGCIIV